jgi:hypothetical protein
LPSTEPKRAETGANNLGQADINATADEDDESWHVVEEACLDEDWQEIDARKLKKEVRSTFGQMGWKFLYEAWAPANGKLLETPPRYRDGA